MIKIFKHFLIAKYLFLENGDPVGGCKPSVALYIIDAIFQVAVPFRQIHLHYIKIV
jgi:hypothetical protein